MRIELTNVNTNKLHDELIKADIIPDLVESLNNITWITIDDSKYDSVMLVISKHNPTPIPPEKTELEKLRDEQDATASAVDFLLMNLS